MPELTDVLIAITLGLFLIVLLRFTLLYHIGFFIVVHEAQSIAAKKHVLSDLILMKDIQTEMEKDLEQASLKATFQG